VKRHKKISKIFLLLFICMFVARTDQGIIPALNTTLKKEFSFTSVQLGKLGSIVYVGAVTGNFKSLLTVIVGSAVSMKLFESLPSRVVIFGSMMLQCLALALFTVSIDYNWQMFARFLSGFSQVILSIYLPVWVDAFAPRHSKTKWMTFIITAAPAGLFLGYSMTAVIVMFDVSWQWAFYRPIIMLIPISQIFFAIKEKYLDVHKRNIVQNASVQADTT
jgi:MFS family permease